MPETTLVAVAVDVAPLLQAEAARYRVVLRQANFAPATAAVPGLRRQQVSAEAIGRYADVKAWLSSVMQSAPALALERLELAPLDDGRSVEARVSMVVFTRVAP